MRAWGTTDHPTVKNPHITFNSPKTISSLLLIRSLANNIVDKHIFVNVLYTSLTIKLEKSKCFFKLSQISKKFFQCMYWRISMYKWTHTVQNHVVQGSTVYFIFKYYLKSAFKRLHQFEIKFKKHFTTMSHVTERKFYGLTGSMMKLMWLSNKDL